MIALRRTLFVAGMAVLALLIAVPAFAASGGTIRFTDVHNYAFGPNCAHIYGWYYYDLTADTDDFSGYDFIAVLTVDALGRPLDNDFWGFGPGTYSHVWDSYDPGLILTDIVARPITIALFDIPDPGALDENTLEAANWVLANGSFMDEAVLDPAVVNPAGCAGVPLLDAFSFRAPAPAAFWPGDDRLNQHEGAPVAIYALDGAYEVFGIDPSTGEGLPAFSFDIEGLAAGDVPTVVAEGTNPFSGQPITVYLLPSEELQLNTYYWDGKPYIVTWPLGSVEPGELYVQAW